MARADILASSDVCPPCWHYCVSRPTLFAPLVAPDPGDGFNIATARAKCRNTSEYPCRGEQVHSWFTVGLFRGVYFVFANDGDKVVDIHISALIYSGTSHMSNLVKSPMNIHY